jgi:hypothetical protein
MRPAQAQMVHARSTMANTGRMFLHGLDDLHGVIGGDVGYGWTGRANKTHGSVAIGR